MGSHSFRSARTRSSGAPPRALRGLAIAAVVVVGLLSAAACDAGPPDSAGSSGSQLTPLTVAYPSATTNETALWVAVDKGFFRRNGLDVKPQMLSANPALASLTHDQVQFADIGVAPALTAMARGLPIQLIATDLGMPTWDLVGGNGITSIAKLRGGVVATGTASTLSDVVTRLALQKAGLTPGRDVRLVLVGQAGNTPERVAALTSGKVQGAVIDAGSLGKLGPDAHVLLPYQSLRSVAFAGGGIEASAAYLKAHASVAVAFLRAYQQAVDYVRDPRNEAAVVGVDAKYLQSGADDPAVRKGVDLEIASLPTSIRNDPAAINNTVTVLNQSSTAPISVNLATMVDNSYADKAGV
jgi:ABC-type nitrate/sulfonate/bicarbonate transport system substrate-binding protein